MKALLQTIICCIITISIYAQKNQPTLNIQADKTNWISFEETEYIPAPQLIQNKRALYLQDKDDLDLITEKTDQYGMRHYRYQQTYDGVPIEGAIYLLHEKNNRVKTANGKLIHQLNLNTAPSISVDAALTHALAHIDAELYAWDDPMHENGIKEVKRQADATFYPSGRLVIIDPEFKQQATNCKLAYKFDIYAVQPYTRQEVFVDAHDGSIISTLERIYNCNDVDGASGTSNYSGTVNFTACEQDGTYTLKNNIGGGMQVFYDNYDGDDYEYTEYPFTSTSSNFQNMPEAVDVLWATEQTYNYFLNTFGRNSLNDEGMLLKSWVHHGDDFNNAFWNGSWMGYGDGDGINYSSWTTLDIVAHEMTHGVTQYSANLVYQDEPGALNESFSDIFGEMVEWTSTGTNDWLIGADLVITPGYTGLRDMSNPKAANARFKQPDTYKGEYWHTGTADYGGVHTNSGVQNYWFYLLSEGGSGTNDNRYTYDIPGIGKDKAAAIAYLNLTDYLTEHSTYADARTGAIEAAIEIYGADSEEAIQTEEAWCAVGVGCGPIPCTGIDSLALVAFYNSTNGASWTNTWDLNQPMHTWYGVTINEDGCVTQLILPDNQLSGSIPPEIEDLIDLQIIFLQENQLSGNIPPEIGSLENMFIISLENNQLSGSIPPEIGNLSELRFLFLHNNQLSSSIPPEIGNHSKQLQLNISNNQLTGNIPPEIGNLESITSLRLNGNNLSGSIPPEIGNLSKLGGLYLNDNQLTGNIPMEIGNLGNLDHLYVSNNQLTDCYDINLWSLCDYLDSWAVSVGNNFEETWDDFCNIGSGSCLPFNPVCESDSLNLVALYNATNGPNWTNTWNLNQPINSWYGVTTNERGCILNLELSNNGLNGSIPPEIGNLTNLTRLNLHNNQLDGNIPLEIGNLTKLIFLYLNDNQLTGNIPMEIGNLSKLIGLYLDDNQLDGNIPLEVGNLIELRYLQLYNNELSGTIPPEIRNLTKLISLSLYSNELSGTIPHEIGNFSNLESLRLNDNMLSGSIPSEIENLSLLENLYLNNNQLSGNIPSEIGNLDSLKYLCIYNNQLNGCYYPNLLNLCGQLSVSGSCISNSNNFDATWDDFCNTGAGSCPPPPVYPGDFNNDGTADQHDILYWGLAEGNTGAVRPNATTAWAPQECPEWEGYTNGVNLHHSDGDGNGIVDDNDLTVLKNNFGSTINPPGLSRRNGSSILRLGEFTKTPSSGNFILEYELHIQSNTPISAHGISGAIDLSAFDGAGIISASIDTTGSSLHPVAYVEEYDSSQQMYRVGLTQDDKSNDPLDGSVGTLSIIIDEDLQIGDPIELRTNGGNMISSNGVVTPISPAILHAIPNPAAGAPDLPVSLALSNVCGLGGVAAAYPQGNAPYTYAWSTGETIQQVTGLPVGTHSVTVTDANNIEKVIDFEVEWSFTPVQVTSSSTQICINFDNAPLSEAVEVSLDNGDTYESPITTNTCYDVAVGTYNLQIQNVNEPQCTADLGTWEVEACTSCNCRQMPANLTAIAGEFGQFADDEFIKNFLTAERGYVKYQAEIHRILESDDDRYAQVNQDFETVKDMAMAMLFQSFVSKNPVTMTNEHIKAIDKLLVSLSQATSKDKLRNEITKVRRHLHVMESKDIKDALIAFDRAGAVNTLEMTPLDTPDEDQFDVQLLNTAGRESRVSYNIVKQGILNMNLYNTHGQQVRTLHNGTTYEGYYQIPIDKNGLPPGIYFIHIEYIADGVPINKILKLPVVK